MSAHFDVMWQNLFQLTLTEHFWGFFHWPPISEPEGDPIDCLKYLMEEHGLKQKDMKEIGSPGVVSEVLNRKRTLNARHIKALSNRFNCSTAVFM